MQQDPMSMKSDKLVFLGSNLCFPDSDSCHELALVVSIFASIIIE